MSVLSRVATLAILTLAVAGMAAPTSAVQAAGLAHVALAAPSVISLNLPVADPVPAPAVGGGVQAPIPAEAHAVELAPAIVQAESAQPGIQSAVRPDDTIVYPTLAAAVAAQDATGSVGEDLRCLATSVYFESKGEPLAGQLAVAQVILNRAASGRFGSGVCGVIRQPGQFSFVRGGVVPSVDQARPAWRTAVAVARVALNDAWDSDAERALYFHARRVSPRWNRPRVAAIGNHVFYR